jgi:hypothetical protein
MPRRPQPKTVESPKSEPSPYQPVYDIQAYAEKRLREASDVEIDRCYWLEYESKGFLADAVRNEWHNRGLKANLPYDEDPSGRGD